jgi:hypothetical protein
MIELLRGKIIGGLTTEVAQALATNLDDMTYQNFVLGKIQNLSEEIDTQLQDSKEPMTSNATSGAEIGGKAILELLNENIKEKNADTESKIKIACNNYSGKIEDVGRKDADLKKPITEIKKYIENAHCDNNMSRTNSEIR